MKVWMRPELAGLIASPARSMSIFLARARPQMVLSLTTSATALTASKSPLLAMGKPASMTSTFIFSSALAMRTFSSAVMEAPGLCSPSRRVVSKIISLSLLMGLYSEFVGVWVLVSRISPRQVCLLCLTAEADPEAERTAARRSSAEATEGKWQQGRVWKS